jgi:type II secretory pathway pseudopilin PulG
MKKIKAFTFIELLVVSAILIIISTSSVFYFFWFLDQTKLNTWVDYVKNELKILDNQVRNKNISDYKIFLKKDSLFFYTYENNIDLKNNLLFAWIIDYDTWTWDILLSPLWWSTEALKLEIYANNKFLEDFIIPANSSLNYGFSKFLNYKIKWSYSWQVLNDIAVKYFAESNLDHKKQDYLRLIKIDSEKNNDIDSINIENIFWRKNISDWSNYLILTFDVNGKQKKLKINK